MVYKLNRPTLGIVQKGEQHAVSITIPLHAVITIPDHQDLMTDGLDGNGSRLVEVQWEDKKILVFPQDIRERGESVDGTSGHP